MSQSDPELTQAYNDAKAVLLNLARTDINEFCAYVMRDERTNQPIDQAITHVRMQQACTENERLILWSHVEAGKTFQISVARVLFILGTEPGCTIGIISDTHEQAAKIVRLVAKYIENSPEFAELFPHVKRGEPWTSHHLFLQPEEGRMPPKDPSLQACGVGGNITGSRISHMVWDDILDLENVATQAMRNKTYNWLKSAECMGRLLEGAPLWCVGNAYHPDDALHRLAEEPRWSFMRLAVLDDRGNPTWPERWSAKRIAEKRLDAGPLEFARQMMCQARDDSESRFKREDLDACCARGRGVAWCNSVDDLLSTPWPLPPGALIAMPATSPHVGEDRAAVHTSVDDAQAAQEDAQSKSAAGRVPQGLPSWARKQGGKDASPGVGDGAADPMKLFPDLAQLHSATHSSQDDTPQEYTQDASMPAWLALRQGRETLYSGSYSEAQARIGGPKVLQNAVYSPLGVQDRIRNAPSSPTSAHIVHTPQDTKPNPPPTDDIPAIPTAPTSHQDASDTPTSPTGTAKSRASIQRSIDHPNTPQVDQDSGPYPAHAGEDVSETYTLSGVHPGGEGGTNPEKDTPPILGERVDLSFEKMSGVGFDNEADNLTTVPKGAPAGVQLALDSYGWLGKWLGDPGTPHRSPEGWPCHPRSLSALARLGVKLYTGVDLAVQKHSAADFTVLYTIAVYAPHGEHGLKYRRVLEIQRGKWYAMDICKRIIDCYDRFGSTIYVENVAAQDYIRQMILEGFSRPDSAQWLFGYTTGRNKANPEFGVEHLAAEFAREQWIFPVPAGWETRARKDSDVHKVRPELQQNFNEILYYDPKEHTGDVLMAMWLAKEASRITEPTKPMSIGMRSF